MADAVSVLKGSGPPRGLRTGGQPAASARRLGVLIKQGDAARDRRDWREAARLYELVLQASPKSRAIQIQLGHAYKELSDFNRAALNYDAALKHTPSDDDLHLQIGHLEKLKGNLQEAAAYYRKATELNPANTDAIVEYYALAPKLGLPPLPSPSGSDHQELIEVCGGTGEAFSLNADSPVHRIHTTDSRLGDDRLGEGLDRADAPGSGSRPKVLFVSDSLGTPIHGRGIYHYSIALAEILRDMGFDITLVVEKSREYGLERRTLKLRPKLSPEALDTYQLSEVYRYFNNDIFSFRWEYEDRFLRGLVEKSPSMVRLAQRAYDHIGRRYQRVIRNASNRIQLAPQRGHHLRKFDQFLYINRFYSDSMSRAVNDLSPVSLNAAGYDLVVIDTPHYIRVKSIHRSHIFTVIHDLIPVYDPFMGGDWRRLFLGKLRTSLAIGGNLIFVSDHTRSLFHTLFPKYAPRRELVLYPSIPKDWRERATYTGFEGGSAYIAAIGRNRGKDRREHIRLRAARMTDDPESRGALIEELEAELPSWDGSLPYFATVTSDEPRKNIAIFCKVSEQFIGKANFLIVGQVDGNRYMNHEPELYPNIHFTGYLDDDRKADVIRHAAAVIFPSFSEGFGIPIVEGALLGVPVICSNLAVFHEITQNLAIYFDPNSVDELTMRINELLANRIAYVESATRLHEIVSTRFSQQAMQRRLQKTLRETGVLTW